MLFFKDFKVNLFAFKIIALLNQSFNVLVCLVKLSFNLHNVLFSHSFCQFGVGSFKILILFSEGLYFLQKFLLILFVFLNCGKALLIAVLYVFRLSGESIVLVNLVFEILLILGLHIFDALISLLRIEMCVV